MDWLNNEYDNNYYNDYRSTSNWWDEDMYACTEQWRSLNPYGYNPFTCGYDAEQDYNNGW